MKKIFVLLALLTFGINLYAWDVVTTHDNRTDEVLDTFMCELKNQAVEPMEVYEWAEECNYMRISKLSLSYKEGDNIRCPRAGHSWKIQYSGYDDCNVIFNYFWLGTEVADDGQKTDYFIVVVQYYD